jgi:superfamily II DNA/RNA helicase
VPIALLGCAALCVLSHDVAHCSRDCCANAVTGSGKTAAFALPLLERLVHRPSYRCDVSCCWCAALTAWDSRAVTRVVVLLPTRELAAQCYDVITKLAKYVDVGVCVVAGGTSLHRCVECVYALALTHARTRTVLRQRCARHLTSSLRHQVRVL